MRSVSLLRYRCGIFFSLSPDPLSPALPNLLASACSPAPGAWEALAAVDLLLRAWLRSACLLPCRAALSLPLVRYSWSVRPAWACCLTIPSVPFRHLPRLPVPRLRADRAVLGSASRLPCRLAARFPFPRLASLPDGRGADGVVLSLACLSVRLIETCCGVLVRACVFPFSVGFAAVMCAVSWMKRRGCR